ncbi:Histone deacetylase complex subunit SAP30 [Theobroma cacao]|nr:Histone deacetylase complex subunit SAP30 [Theobroma cacao]
MSNKNTGGYGAKLNVNLARLRTDSLRRYCKLYNIDNMGSDSSREQMLNAVQQHFASQPLLHEQQVIPEFVDAIRTRPKDKKN